MRDPFSNGQTVIGVPLLKMIDWVYESEKFLRSEGALESSLPPQPQSVIALPPIQRSSVWRPKQVVDLWDSIMRGFPIGMFYLIKRQREDLSGTLTGKTKRIHEPGYDLLDGQQRVRALLLGTVGFSVEERCLWVDLGDKDASQHPVLRITSKGQPFGYDAQTGNKLSLKERWQAREKLDKDAEILHKDRKRSAYDRELFDDEELTQHGKPFSPQPPLPYGADSRCTIILPKLLSAWRGKDPSDSDKGIAVFRTVAGSVPSDEALKRLHDAFERIRRAEVALLCIDPDNLYPKREALLPLFDRIGAGGTPLSGDERLYSIYKYRYPHIRDAVNQIYKETGRVLPPTKIAAAAIRIAYAQSKEDRNDTPDIAAFSRMMDEAEQQEEQKKFRNHLELLIPRDREKAQENTLSSSFQSIKNLLAYKDGVGHFWVPDVLLASLPAELWQVLLFWAASHPKPENLEQSRGEAARFVLFWYLCVFNNKKAARWAFASIKESTKDSEFPGLTLYRLFIGKGEECCARGLISPEELREKLCKEEASSWRTDADRFVVNGTRDHFLSDWWYGGRKILPWLQRDYIQRAFPQYVPLAEHEDDLPYDVDHLCPAKDWGDNWPAMKKRLDGLDETIKSKVRECGYGVGNGVGNLRLVESSQNRKDQDIDIADKMSFILCGDQPVEEGAANLMANFAFAPGHREIWSRVSSPGPVSGRKWDGDRLKAFQTAVELRAAWLYERFHDDLGYGQWTNAGGK